VAGYVADLDRYLGETAAFVVPLQSGAGMRVKILDAWCRALPVVSTSIGAEGIRTSHGDNVLLCDSEAAFADDLIRVLRDPVLARRLADNGRATVEAEYDWRNTYLAWDAVYQ
jgi:glycosyltransferase involved in cell wall biosynthesis